MQKKTAIRQLRKFMPMSPQARAFHVAAGLDESGDAGLSQAFEIDPSMFKVQEIEPEYVTESGPYVTATPEGDEPPSDHGRCPIHLGSDGFFAAWGLNKHGFSHRIHEGDGYCNPSKLVLELATKADLIEETNPWLKETFGVTRSGVELQMLPVFIEWIATNSGETIAPELQQEVTPEPGEEAWPE